MVGEILEFYLNISIYLSIGLLMTMRLHELMDSRFVTVSANDYAAEALQLMQTRKLSWCFVLDRNEIAGLVWAKDLARSSDMMLKERDVREYIAPGLPTVNIETDSQDALRLLQRSGQRILGIIKNNLPVGILTQESLTLRQVPS
jgi:predicted transcriptional regulator